MKLTLKQIAEFKETYSPSAAAKWSGGKFRYYPEWETELSLSDSFVSEYAPAHFAAEKIAKKDKSMSFIWDAMNDAIMTFAIDSYIWQIPALMLDETGIPNRNTQEYWSLTKPKKVVELIDDLEFIKSSKGRA